MENIKSVYKNEFYLNELNSDHLRRLNNPESFKYDNYFDGFTEEKTLMGHNLPKVSFRN